MGVLMLRCPTTGRGFADVNTDEATFRRLPDTLSTAHCPHCGQEVPRANQGETAYCLTR
jgi:hypothetical protein